MSPTEAAAKLQHFNDWRRGHHDDTAQPDPREIGEAIDAVIEILDRLEAAEKERDALRSKIETAENDDAHQKALAASALRVAEGWERKCGELRAKITEMEQPSAEWFDWLPQGTTHISSIRAVTIPCFGLKARFNAFKYIAGVLYTYRTDTDNEYGEWVKADSRYRNAVLPTVYPLSGVKGEEK